MHISKKILAIAAGSALALTMAACGGGGGGARSAAGDTLTIGIKYDSRALARRSAKTTRASTSMSRGTSPKTSGSRATR